MKKTILITIVTLAVAGTYAFGRSFKKVPAGKQVKGKVIYIDESSMEIKRGLKEYTLHFDADTVVEDKVAEIERDSLEICQEVRAYYVTKEGKKVLKKVIIVKESDCQL